MVTFKAFIHRFKSYNHLLQYNEHYHRKALLSSTVRPDNFFHRCKG